MDRGPFEDRVSAALSKQPITDVHTHCYAPQFGAAPQPGGLLLWGIDELVTYHYLIAEVYRVVPATDLPYEQFWRMSTTEQADHIWTNLFVARTPMSEACRGVLTALQRLGLDPNEKTLAAYRRWFAEQTPDAYVDRVMELAHVDRLLMTNDVFDNHERERWLGDPQIGSDSRFAAVLRIDPLLRQWPQAVARLRAWGYDASADFAGQTTDQVRRFLADWITRMKAEYVAMSLPPTFRYPDPNQPEADRFIQECLMPVCADHGLPWGMMIGSKLGVNAGLRDAGDMLGKADIQSVVNLCEQFPKNKFLVTMLSRENQHELCVAARKFGNLMVFGCWWFLNNPSIVEEITRERLELLGTSFIPQHSDARILDQVIYKWDHSLRVIGKVLTDKYVDLAKTGFLVTNEYIQRDVGLLLRDNYRQFLAQ